MSSPTNEDETKEDPSFKATVTNMTVLLEHSSFEEKLVSAPPVAQRFFTLKKGASGIMPPVVRGLANDFSFIMLEKSPRRVLLNNSNDELTIITIPWTVWIAQTDQENGYISNLWVYARNDVIVTPDQMLYHLDLPGIHTDGLVPLTDQHWSFHSPQHMWTKLSNITGAIGKAAKVAADDDKLKPFMDLTPETAIDLTFEPAAIPSVIADWYGSQGDSAGFFLTVGHWLEYFDYLSHPPSADSASPLLDFFHRLVD